MRVQASSNDEVSSADDVCLKSTDDGEERQAECPFHRLSAALVRAGDNLEIQVATHELFSQECVKCCLNAITHPKRL